MLAEDDTALGRAASSAWASGQNSWIMLPQLRKVWYHSGTGAAGRRKGRTRCVVLHSCCSTGYSHYIKCLQRMQPGKWVECMKGRIGIWWTAGVAGLTLGMMLWWHHSAQAGYQPVQCLPSPQPVFYPVAFGERVDLNRASLAQLEQLPGIGPQRGRAILAYRIAHGGFRYPEELIYVEGFGQALVEGLLTLVTVS